MEHAASSARIRIIHLSTQPVLQETAILKYSNPHETAILRAGPVTVGVIAPVPRARLACGGVFASLNAQLISARVQWTAR